MREADCTSSLLVGEGGIDLALEVLSGRECGVGAAFMTEQLVDAAVGVRGFW